jgi:hypothetical protein
LAGRDSGSSLAEFEHDVPFRFADLELGNAFTSPQRNKSLAIHIYLRNHKGGHEAQSVSYLHVRADVPALVVASHPQIDCAA